MEAVLGNVRRTVELLAVSRTSSVSAWSDLQARRATSWSRYCQHIHHRFHTHPAICRVLEKTLRDANQRLRDDFEGYEDIALLDLSRCQELLVQRMLHNPATPTTILKMLFEPPSPAPPHQGHLDGDSEDGSGHCLRVVQYRSACRVLSAVVSSSTPGPVSDGLSTSWSSGGAEAEVPWSSGGAEAEVPWSSGGAEAEVPWSSGGAEAEVQAEMLMERLDALLLLQGHGPAGIMAEQLLDSMVAAPTCPPPDHVCRVIAAALLLTTRRQDSAEDVLLTWLQRNQVLMQQMCLTLSSGLLSELIQRHQNLRVPYVDLLKTWASHMTYDLSQARWLPGDAADTRTSFKTLTRRLQTLLSEPCPSLRDSVMEDLRRLKVSDGDFDVRGLSVWTDLLSDMKT